MGSGNGVAKHSEKGVGGIFMKQRLFSYENLLALALCGLVIALLILTTDAAPQWIYQGF